MPEQPSTHTCGNCTRYVAVIDGWCRDYEADGYTPSERVHVCGESDRRVLRDRGRG